VHVVRSVDSEIDASAVEAVQQWRFEAARKDGKPVSREGHGRNSL